MKKEIVYQQVIEVGCGIDVHKDVIVATIRKNSKDYETREFNSFTSSLTDLKDWCKQEKVTHIAMESTGIYWKPVFNVLEDASFEIILVNARHVKNIPGHKTDKKDSAWLSKLLLSGLLKGSFIPSVDIRELRDLVRYKKKKTQQAAADKNRMIKILEDCNVKLSSVVSDVQGVSATKIIDAITNGETDIDVLVSFIHGKVKTDRDVIKKALEGKVTAHHRFMLQMARESINVTEALIKKLDDQIEIASKAYQVEIQLLQTIDGVRKDSAIAIISEIGVDMEQFPNEHHLASWSGVSPGNNESAGKKKSSRTIHGNKHLQATLTESAWGASRKKDGYFKQKYQKLLVRKGSKKAIVAVAHKIIIAAYQVIKKKEAYTSPLLDDTKFNEKQKQKEIQKTIVKMNKLGFTVRITPII